MKYNIYNQIKNEKSLLGKLNVVRYDKNLRKIILQIIFSFFLLYFLYYLVTRSFNLDLGLSHLSSRAGFGISHQFLTDYTSNDSRWDAYFIGLVNTIRVSIVGIAFATILGILMGLARLSKNFLLNKISTAYVEIIRNTPLLVQLIFWQLALLQLPQISNALTFGELSVWSNRGILLPYVNSLQNGELWVLCLLTGLIISLVIRSYASKHKEENVNFFSPSIIAISVFILIAVSTYVILGVELYADIPHLTQNQYGTYIQSGGFTLTPEFATVLFSLVLYTGTFITEIVRGSIQSLPKGQTEAAKALGLNNYQTTTLIILPQALRSIIPPLTNQYLNLTKNSSLSVAVAYPEVFMVSRTIMNNSGHALPMLALILSTFLTLSLIISLFMNLLNRQITRIGA
ncbi:MAG: ABC transporter permease subunit [SAR202 cluster bacterium]|nr:MAG: ABC transporter permease subunit [SAR202 cluster bacterium]